VFLTVGRDAVRKRRLGCLVVPPLALFAEPELKLFHAAAGAAFIARVNLLCHSTVLAPAGSSPRVAQRHKATSNLRAKATMPTLRLRVLPAAKRDSYHWVNSLSGW